MLRQLILVLEINSIWLIELLDISGVLISTWEKTMNFPHLTCQFGGKWSAVTVLSGVLLNFYALAWNHDDQTSEETHLRQKIPLFFSAWFFPLLFFLQLPQTFGIDKFETHRLLSGLLKTAATSN